MATMEKITLEAFTAFLQQEKDVYVTFLPTSKSNGASTFRYQLDKNGYVFEVYNYNHTIYEICHILDTQSMCDTFLMSLRCAIKMEATSDEDKALFNGVFF